MPFPVAASFTGSWTRHLGFAQRAAATEVAGETVFEQIFVRLNKLCAAHLTLSCKHTFKPCLLEIYWTDSWETRRKHLSSSEAHFRVLWFQAYSDFQGRCSP